MNVPRSLTSRTVVMLCCVLIALAADVAGAAAPQPSAAGGADTAAMVASIRRHYQAINGQQAGYRKIQADLSGYSEEGGELTGYYDGVKIRKIVARFFGETGQLLEEYYFAADTLVFMYSDQQEYTEPLPASKGKVKSSRQNRYYFTAGRLLQWLDETKRPVPSSDPRFAEAQKRILTDAADYQERLAATGTPNQ